MTGRATPQPPRWSSVSTAEAVRAVQHPESNTPEMRAYYRMTASERKTTMAVRDAGGDETFLLSGQRGVWEDDDGYTNVNKKQEYDFWKSKDAPKNYSGRKSKISNDEYQQLPSVTRIRQVAQGDPDQFCPGQYQRLRKALKNLIQRIDEMLEDR